MANTGDLVFCPCGKSFKDSQALMQHTRDSARHLQRTMPGPLITPAAPNLQSKVTCTCGEVFHSAEALQQHQRDSHLHAETNRVKRTGGVKCSCGKTVKDENGLKSHMRTSSHYRKLEQFHTAAANDGDKSYGFLDIGVVGLTLAFVLRENMLII